jgi:hypothetical protein
MQSKRMDEQRVELPHLPGLVPPPGQSVLQRLSIAAGPDAPGPDDNFFDMLMRCQVLTKNNRFRLALVTSIFDTGCVKNRIIFKIFIIFSGCKA